MELITYHVTGSNVVPRSSLSNQFLTNREFTHKVDVEIVETVINLVT